MQIQLKRKQRHVLAVAGYILFMAGMASLLCGAVVYPTLQVLLRLGRFAIVAGVSLIVLNFVVWALLSAVPSWKRSGGQYLEAELEFNSPLRTAERCRCEMMLVPHRSMTILNWSVKVVGIQYLEERLVHRPGTFKPPQRVEVAYAEDRYERLLKSAPTKLTGILFVPDFPSHWSTQDEGKTQWRLDVSLRCSGYGTFEGWTPIEIIHSTAADSQL